MSNDRQRQRHGVTKNIAAVIGGTIVGAAVVLFISNRLKARAKAETKPNLRVVPSNPSDTTASE